jgi:hypothetical protein
VLRGRSSTRLQILVLANGNLALQDFQPIDRNGGIDVEAELHGSASDFEHRHFEQMLEAARAADYDCFLDLSRQNQHGQTSIAAPEERGIPYPLCTIPEDQIRRRILK